MSDADALTAENTPKRSMVTCNLHWSARVWTERYRVLALTYAATLPLSMTASWVVLTIGLVVLIVDLLVSRTIEPLRRIPLTAPLLFLSIAVFVSGLCNGGIGEAWRSVESLRALLIYFWAVVAFRRNRSLAAECMQTVISVGAVAGLWGTIQQLWNIHPTSFRYLQGTGFLGGPMAYAGQMQIFSMLALSFFFADKGERANMPRLMQSRWVAGLLAVMNLSGLVFAGERSAWLGGLAGTVVLSGMVSLRVLIATGAVSLVSGVMSWFAVPLIRTRLEALFSPHQDVSTQTRLQIWQTAIDLWKRSPWVGVGYRRFPHLDFPQAIVPGKSKWLDHAHSNYLHMLATAGLFGLVAYIWLCVAQFKYGIDLIKRRSQEKGELYSCYGRIIVSVTVALMISGIFEYNFGTSQVRLAQWFVMALLGLLAVDRFERQCTNEAVNQPDTRSTEDNAEYSIRSGQLRVDAHGNVLIERSH